MFRVKASVRAKILFPCMVVQRSDRHPVVYCGSMSSKSLQDFDRNALERLSNPTKPDGRHKRGNSPLAAPRPKQQKKAGKAGCFKLQPMGKGTRDSTVNMQTNHTVMAVLSENGNAVTADVVSVSCKHLCCILIFGSCH